MTTIYYYHCAPLADGMPLVSSLPPQAKPQRAPSSVASTTMVFEWKAMSDSNVGHPSIAPGRSAALLSNP
jgi:hypothetical protein